MSSSFGIRSRLTNQDRAIVEIGSKGVCETGPELGLCLIEAEGIIGPIVSNINCSLGCLVCIAMEH